MRRAMTRLGSLGAAAVALVAVTMPGVSPSSSVVVDQHVTIAGESEVGSPWMPATLRCDSYCFVRARAFFDSVAAFGSDGQVHGMLAESIVPNSDFTEWTITVRPGISFTDGTAVDADAVITNLQATGINGLLATALSDVAKVPDPAHPGDVMLDIDKVDDMTLTVHTGASGDPARPLPWRDFPHLLTGQWGLIASPRWLDAVADDPALAAAPIGSGPFIVDSYEPYGSLEAHRNPDYWMTDADGQQLPYLDSISFRVIEDPQTSVEALEAGDIDLFATTNGLAITDAQARDDEVSVTVQDTFVDSYYLLIDLSKPGPLQDRRVRCAMSLAIDRDEFNDATSNGFDPSANGLFSPGQQGYLADNGLPMDQDLETARALIADYESATGTDVQFTLGHTPPNAISFGAQLLEDWWSSIGIDVDDRTIPQSDLINRALVGAPDFEVFLWREHAGALVDQQHLWWHSSNAAPDGTPSLNLGRLRDPAIDAALDRARTATTEDEATTAAADINRIIARECYAIPLAWVPWAVMSAPDVSGLGQLVLPDGTDVLGPVGLNGQYLLQTLRRTND